MPSLDIGHDPKRNALSVLGVMLYPSDQDRRAELLAAGYAADVDRDSSLTAEVWPWLLNAPPLQNFFDEPAGLLLKAWHAGEILKTIAIIENEGTPASVRKAIHCVGRRCLGARTLEGKGVAYTPASIRQGWEAFKTVTHLWAAAHSWGDEARPVEQLRLEWLREVQFGD